MSLYNTGIETEIGEKSKRIKRKLEESINNFILQEKNRFPFIDILEISTDGTRVKVEGLVIYLDGFNDGIASVDSYLSKDEHTV